MNYADLLQFSVDPTRHLYPEGGFFLGHMPVENKAGEVRRHAIGIKSERHAITTAGSRAGKGACVIIPNLKLWPHNTLTIDPKGEAAKETAADREAMGQAVRIIDPFLSDNVPAKYRASYNPLADLDLDALTIKEDITTISDGIIMRANPDSEHWDNGAQRILSGLIAYALLKLPPAKQNLIEIRAIIRNEKRFEGVIEEMKNLDGCEGLAQAGASAAWAKEGGYFVSNLDKNTEWLDSKAMRNVLTESSFTMRDLKREALSVYLVLPPKYIAQHGRFLRLFVRCGIDAMSTDEVGDVRRCLFMLDEFFTLGYIDEIAKAAGLMAGYGLQMWVILQDLGQLEKLYGRDGSETFFGNADLHQFFGNRDPMTLKWISAGIGNYNVDDLPDEPQYRRIASTGDPEKDKDNEIGMRYDRETYQEALSRFNTTASRVIGKPRLSPEQISYSVRKDETIAPVAVASICFITGGKTLAVGLVAHWKLDTIIFDMTRDEIIDWCETGGASANEPPTKERSWGVFGRWFGGGK